jgi:integrase
MGRPRTKNRNLPTNVYFRHGAYYHVRAGKWTLIGKTLPDAMLRYAQIVGLGEHTMSLLLDETMAEAEKRNLAAATLISYRHAAERLREMTVEFAVSDVKPKHVAEIMDEYADKAAWANIMRTVLKLAFDLAVRRGWVDYNPVSSIPRFGQTPRSRYITHAEYQAIYAAGNDTLKAVMTLCYLTGQRISDVLKIRESDITDDGIEFDQGKTDKKLLVRWNPDLQEAVRYARSLNAARTLYLLGQRNGKIRSYGGVKDLWKRACETAGVEDAHIHDLRAKSLTDAKKQGHNPTLLAGHTSEAMTRRYLRSRERDEVDGPSFGQIGQIAKKTG